MKVLSKKELMRQMKRFVADKDRGISVALFAKLCGLTPDKMWTIFITETEPLSEYTQLRVNKAFAEWREGNVRVMRDGHRKYVDYRRQAIPPLMPSTRLNLTAGVSKSRWEWSTAMITVNLTLTKHLEGNYGHTERLLLRITRNF